MSGQTTALARRELHRLKEAVEELTVAGLDTTDLQESIAAIEGALDDARTTAEANLYEWLRVAPERTTIRFTLYFHGQEYNYASIFVVGHWYVTGATKRYDTKALAAWLAEQDLRYLVRADVSAPDTTRWWE